MLFPLRAANPSERAALAMRHHRCLFSMELRSCPGSWPRINPLNWKQCFRESRGSKQLPSAGLRAARRQRAAAVKHAAHGELMPVRAERCQCDCQSARQFGSDSLLMQLERVSGALISGESAPCSKPSTAPAWCRVGLLREVRAMRMIRLSSQFGHPEASAHVRRTCFPTCP